MVKRLFTIMGCLMVAALILSSCVRSQDYSLSGIKDADKDITLFSNGISVSLNEAKNLCIDDFIKPSGILKKSPDGSFSFELEGSLGGECVVVPSIKSVKLPDSSIAPNIPEDIREKANVVLHTFRAAVIIDNTSPFEVEFNATAVARREGCSPVSFPVKAVGAPSSVTTVILDESVSPGLCAAVNLSPDAIDVTDITLTRNTEGVIGSGSVKVSYSFSAPFVLDEGSWFSFSKVFKNNIKIAKVNRSRMVIDASAESTLTMKVLAYLSVYVNGELIDLPEPIELDPCTDEKSSVEDVNLSIGEREWSDGIVIGDILVNATCIVIGDGVGINGRHGLGVKMKELSFPEGITIGGEK